MSTITTPEPAFQTRREADRERRELAHKYGEVSDDMLISSSIDAHFRDAAECLDISKAHALVLLRKRFGCVYKALSDGLKRDPDILREAAVLSSGHELAHAPKDVLEAMNADDYIELIRAGARFWIVEKFAPQAVKEDPIVRTFVAETAAKDFEKHPKQPDQNPSNNPTDRLK